jgi:hypothetical protein
MYIMIKPKKKNNIKNEESKERKRIPKAQMTVNCRLGSFIHVHVAKLLRSDGVASHWW